MAKPYGYIYLTENLINHRKYIGRHKSEEYDPNYKGSGSELWRAINKYGWDNFSNEIICWCYSEDDLNSTEEFLVDYYDCVSSPEYYNERKGGLGGSKPGAPKSEEFKQKMSEIMTGRVLSEATKAKISAHSAMRNPEVARKCGLANRGKIRSEEFKSNLSKKFSGEGHPMYGKHHSEESKFRIKLAKQAISPSTREKISLAKKGKPLSAEHRLHISQGNQGKVLTEDHKNHISEGRLGMHFSEDHKKNLSIARKSAKYHCVCKLCSKEFLGRSPRSRTCDDCKAR